MLHGNVDWGTGCRKSPVPSLTKSLSKVEIRNLNEQLDEREQQLKKAAMIGQELLKQVEDLQIQVLKLKSEQAEKSSGSAPSTPERQISVKNSALPPSTAKSHASRYSKIAKESPQKSRMPVSVSRTPSPLERKSKTEYESMLLIQTRTLREQLESSKETKLCLENEKDTLSKQLEAANQLALKYKAAEKGAAERTLQLEQELEYYAEQLEVSKTELQKLESQRLKQSSSALHYAEQLEKLKIERESVIFQLSGLQKRLEADARDFKRQIRQLECDKETALALAHGLESELSELRRLHKLDATPCYNDHSFSEFASLANSDNAEDNLESDFHLNKDEKALLNLLQLQNQALRDSLDEHSKIINELNTKLEQSNTGFSKSAASVVDKTTLTDAVRCCSVETSDKQTLTEAADASTRVATSEATQTSSLNELELSNCLREGAYFEKFDRFKKKKQKRFVWYNELFSTVLWSKASLKEPFTGKRRVVHSAVLVGCSLKVVHASVSSTSYELHLKMKMPDRDLILSTADKTLAESFIKSFERLLYN